MDTTTLPTADDEYTPAHRRVIDSRLAESEKDFKKGGTYGPFNTTDEMIAHMRSALKRRGTTKKTKHTRRKSML